MARREQYIVSTVYFTRVNLFYQALVCLEGVLYVDDPGCAFVDEYPDHVETQGVEAWSPIEEVSLGQGADGGLFAGGDGFEWMPEAGSATQFHFDKDEGIAVAQDQVQLPVTGPVVALDEDVPPPRQVAQGEIFAPRAGATFAQGVTTPA
jgi:hypothetical protein